MKSILENKAVLQGLLIGIAVAVAGCQGVPQRNAAAPPERQQMAALHEEVARCLRSAQPMSTCQDTMRKHCEAMKPGGCSMMDMASMHGAMDSKGDKAVDPGTPGQHQH